MGNIAERVSNYSKERGSIAVTELAQLELQDGVSGDNCVALDELAYDVPVGESRFEHELAELALLAKKEISKSYEAWEQVIKAGGPYEYYAVLSFLRPYSDRQSTEALDQLLRFLNRALWGPRWKSKGCGLRGTVVAERHRLSRDLRGRLHFNLLLQRPTGIADDNSIQSCFSSAVLKLRDASKRQMSATDRLYNEPIENIDWVVGYLTKELQCSDWNRGDNVFFIRPEGIDCNVMPPRTAAQLRRQH
ncbi:hypothetical protein [Pseudoxanthomonas sp. CF125]|uniref:hypothetical protein n=1 Tax=Pseudoxanthomonas sp. CF125 TaxID=1855303 RepID=UPI00088A8C43|nr:hypothetical protein [Pseudoxanthomonas sp. CF125]SDQ24363.1 hypothetical protein SAMN05216569_0262 [Pseudoxanthomonas sp. CF125]